jgi:PEP-CTERM motif
MVKFFKSLVFVACGLFSATAAHADPVLVYTFETTSISCDPNGYAPNCATLPFQQEQLDDMYIGLAPSALSNGSATLNYSFFGGFGPATVNTGVKLMGIYLYNTGSYTRVHPDGFVISPYDQANHLLTEISLTVGQYLTGSLYVNNSESDIEMSSPLGGTEWQGRFRSDALGGTTIFFSGNWRFSGVVPEPGTLALLMSALAGVALASNRRFPRVRMARNTQGRTNGSTWT